MKETYDIKSSSSDKGDVQLRWLSLWEKIVFTVLLSFPLVKGVDLYQTGIDVLQGKAAPALAGSSGWTRLITGFVLMGFSAHAMVRVWMSKGQIVIQFKRFRDNVIQFPRGGRPKL